MFDTVPRTSGTGQGTSTPPRPRLGPSSSTNRPGARPCTPSRAALYSRVSGHGQRPDLDRQAARLRGFAVARSIAASKEVVEISSGVSNKRPKLLSLLSDASIGTIVVERRDRLTRFGLNYIEAMMEARGGSVLVMNEQELEDDLVEDLVAIMTSLTARLYGRLPAGSRVVATRKALESE